MSTTAPLRNVALLHRMIDRLIDGPPHLPRIGCMSGPSGFAKSFAAASAAGEFRAYYVQVRSYWTRKSMLTAILRQMGIAPPHTIAEMVDAIAEQLALSGRPLIIDEADHIARAHLVELVRDLYEQSQAPMVLIGEETLPQQLIRWERFHGRVREWCQAAPCNVADARQLAPIYAPGTEVGDDLLERVVEVSSGSTRRVCVNLDRVGAWARSAGVAEVTLRDWGDRELHTGEPPAVRTFRRAPARAARPAPAAAPREPTSARVAPFPRRGVPA